MTIYYIILYCIILYYIIYYITMRRLYRTKVDLVIDLLLGIVSNWGLPSLQLDDPYDRIAIDRH